MLGRGGWQKGQILSADGSIVKWLPKITLRKSETSKQFDMTFVWLFAPRGKVIFHILDFRYFPSFKRREIKPRITSDVG